MVVPVEKRRDLLDTIYQKQYGISYYELDLSYVKCLTYDELAERYKDNIVFTEPIPDNWYSDIDDSDAISFLETYFCQCGWHNDEKKIAEIQKNLIMMMNAFLDDMHENNFTSIVTD